MSCVWAEFCQAWTQFLQKMRISSSLKAEKNEPVFIKVDEKRTRTNYIKLMWAALLIMLSEFCGMLYHMLFSVNPIYRDVYIFLFSSSVFVAAAILICEERELKKGGPTLKTARISTMLFWSYSMINAITCSYVEAMDTGTLLQYWMYVLILSLLPVFKPYFLLPYILVSVAAQMAILAYAGSPLIMLIFVAATAAFCCFAAYYKYADYMSKHMTMERLEMMAEYDALTQLLNRRGMKKRVDILVDYTARVQEPITVAIVDIDFFKNYNDSYGHDEGDKCLQMMAKCLLDNYRRKTDIVCRYGGEEFLIIFVGEDEEHSVQNLEHFLKAVLKEKVPSGNPDFHPYVTVSIGAVTVQTQLDETLRTHLKKADENLYMAKKDGRNRLCINGHIHTV